MWATCLSTPLLSLWPNVSDYIIYQIFTKFSGVGVCYKHCYLRVSFVPTGSATVLAYSVSTHTSNTYCLLGVKFGVRDFHKTLQGNTATHTLMFSLGYTHVKRSVDVLDDKCKVYVFAQQITGSPLHTNAVTMTTHNLHERNFVIQ